MNDTQKFFVGLFAFCCAGAIYGILTVIYFPEYSNYGGLLTAIAFADMLLVEIPYVLSVVAERRAQRKREAEKTWIDRALEGGI